MTIEQRIINVAEKQNYYDSRELRAIALEVRKREDRIKQLEEEIMEVKNKHSVLVADVVLDEDRAERIKQLQDRINRASIAFFENGSDARVARWMMDILEEERGKK